MQDILEEEFRGKLTLRLWLSIIAHAWRYKANVIVLMVQAILCAVGDSAFGLLNMAVIDEAQTHGASPRLLGWGAAYLGVVLGMCTCIWVFIYNAGKIASHVSHDFRCECFAKLQDLSFSYYDTRPVGWLLSRITSDCDRLSRIIAWGLLDLVWAVCLVALISIIMLWLNWRLALVVLAVVPPLALVSKWFQTRILLASRAQRKSNSLITASYNEELMGVRTTKALVREDDNLHEFGKLADEMYAHSFRNAMLSAVYYPIVLTLGAAAAGAALWYGGYLTMAGAMSLGILVAFIGYAGQFFGPIGQAANILTQMQGAQAAGERVVSLLQTEPQIRDGDDVKARMMAHAATVAETQPPDSPNSSLAPDGYAGTIDTIEFRHVNFAYKEGTPVLEDFNFRVRAGQTIALVGPTGGGKSTIVSLICRFYEPTGGEILINGIDYRRRSLHWLQSTLGIVQQTPHLFSGTVRENIRYGRLDATDAEVEDAARLAHAHGFITALDKGYDSDVGEGGRRLSTGQKQLVSFARALLARPQVFVMDEATSSIDTQTEHLIQQGMAAVLRGRTSFVIAHRLSTIRAADVILVVDGGRIVEQGNHQELLHRGGRYYELYTSHSRMDREKHLLEEQEAAAS